MSSSHLYIATAMCKDCNDASQLVLTGAESNLRIQLIRLVSWPATLIVPYEFLTYGFSVADITAFTTLSKNVGDKTAVAAKLAKRTCLGDMSATFWRHMQLRRKEWSQEGPEIEEDLLWSSSESRSILEVPDREDENL